MSHANDDRADADETDGDQCKKSEQPSRDSGELCANAEQLAQRDADSADVEAA